MGCGKSQDQAKDTPETPGSPPHQVNGETKLTPSMDSPKSEKSPKSDKSPRDKSPRAQPGFGWRMPGAEVCVEPPNPLDPPFMQTVAPSGTTWGQYVRTSSSFVNPKTGLLAGPWAECIAWAVIFEHTSNWEAMPQYSSDGVVSGVLSALEQRLKSRPDINEVIALSAAEKLEDASHDFASSGGPMSPIHQVVALPKSIVCGQHARCENPQSPGTFMLVKVPAKAKPDHKVIVPVPAQPNKAGQLNVGEVPFYVSSSVAAGAKACESHGVSGNDGQIVDGKFDAEIPDTGSFLSSLF